MLFTEISAKSNTGIKYVFNSLAENILTKIDKIGADNVYGVKKFIEIVDDETFGMLREKISKINGVPVDKIEIYSPEYEKFTGKIIKESHKVSDDKFFGEYNISSGMIIDYVIIP